MTSRLTLLTIFLFTFNLQTISAQDLDTVVISGRITDQNAAVIAGAEDQRDTRQDWTKAFDNQRRRRSLPFDSTRTRNIHVAHFISLVLRRRSLRA